MRCSARYAGFVVMKRLTTLTFVAFGRHVLCAFSGTCLRRRPRLPNRKASHCKQRRANPFHSEVGKPEIYGDPLKGLVPECVA